MAADAVAAARAQKMVRRAIVKGLFDWAYHCKCVDCGEKAYCYDHRDYAKPLEVEPVCRRCNVRRGPAL